VYLTNPKPIIGITSYNSRNNVVMYNMITIACLIILLHIVRPRVMA